MYIGTLKFSHSYFNVYVARVAPLGLYLLTLYLPSERSRAPWSFIWFWEIGINKKTQLSFFVYKILRMLLFQLLFTLCTKFIPVNNETIFNVYYYNLCHSFLYNYTLSFIILEYIQHISFLNLLLYDCQFSRIYASTLWACPRKCAADSNYVFT